MKTPLIRTLFIAAMAFAPMTMMADTPTNGTGSSPTNPGDHGTNVTPNMKPGTGTGTDPEAGTTGKIDSNSPADHGNNGATGKKIDNDSTNTVTPTAPRPSDPGFSARPGVNPTNPGDHGTNAVPNANPGTGIGTTPGVNPSTGTPNPADHGNNTGVTTPGAGR